MGKVKQKDDKDQVSQTIESKDIEMVNSFISNKENQEKAEEVARQIKKSFRNWFTLRDFIKYFNISLDDAKVQLRSLIMFRLCFTRENKVSKQAEFKITLTKEGFLKMLEEQLKEIEIQRTLLIEEINDLRKEK